jgi:hypothetical protein
VKKVKLSERTSVRHLAALESEVFRDHMAIIEHLAMLMYEDGTPRQGGYLSVWVEGSQWRVQIKDRDAAAKLSVVGRTLDEALTLLHMLLGCEDAPWEPDAQQGRSGGRKGK